MKHSENYIVKSIGGENVALPVNDAYVDFNTMIRLNEVAMDVYECVGKGYELAEIVDYFMNEYDGVDAETVENDIKECLAKLIKLGIVE